MIEHLEDEVALLERHLEVLQQVAVDEPVGIISLSTKLPYPRHQVRYSLRKLERNGLIEPTDTGAVTTERAREDFTSMCEAIADLADRMRDIELEPGE